MNNEQKNNGIHSIKETNLVSLIMNLYRILMISKIKKKMPIPNVIFLILFSEKFLVKIKRIEKDSNKLQEMYDLGKNDTLKVLDKLDKYIWYKNTLIARRT